MESGRWIGTPDLAGAGLHVVLYDRWIGVKM